MTRMGRSSGINMPTCSRITGLLPRPRDRRHRVTPLPSPPLLKGRGRSLRSFGCSVCCGLLSIIELKAAKALADQHVAQILGYLRSSRVEHGLLINFGAPKFEIKKYALSRIGEASRPGGLIGGTLSLLASLAPFRGWFQSGF